MFDNLTDTHEGITRFIFFIFPSNACLPEKYIYAKTRVLY